MSASQTLGGTSRCGRVLGPSLDKIIKNAAWRKHSHLVSACKSALDKLDTISESTLSSGTSSSPLYGLTVLEAEFVLQPIILALDSAYAKVAEPALECLFKLFSLGLLQGEIIENADNVAFRLIDSICKVCGIGDETVELAVLRVFLSAVRSTFVLIRGDCLLLLVRTCYNVYLGGLTGTNQICAKCVLAQIMVIVFARVEADSIGVKNIRTVSVSELLEFADKNLNEGSSILYCQNFLNEVIVASEASSDVKRDARHLMFDLRNGDVKGRKGGDQRNDVVESSGESKIREDGFLLFKNICKLSMKFSSQEKSDDQILLRGKILSLELLKVIMDNGGSIWRTNERQVFVLLGYVTKHWNR